MRSLSLTALALIAATTAQANTTYDGKWLLTSTGVISCGATTLAMEVTVASGDITATQADFEKPWTGKVSDAGAIRMRGEQIDSKRMLLIEGHIDENGIGAGQFYAVGGQCRGSFEMKRQ